MYFLIFNMDIMSHLEKVMLMRVLMYLELKMVQLILIKSKLIINRFLLEKL